MKVMMVEFFKNDQAKIQFEIDGKQEELEKEPFVAKFSKQFFGLLITQGEYKKKKRYLYVYNLRLRKYVGFLDLNKLLGDTLTDKDRLLKE
jgi:hypothetical protein